MAAIFHYSSQSDPMPQLTHAVWDKALHLVEYGGLAVLFCRALRGEGVRWTLVVALAIVATSLYGASDEWHQALVPMRESSAQDWVVDTLGASCGVAVYWRVSRAARRPRQLPR
jgi:VanZ family protein